MRSSRAFARLFSLSGSQRNFSFQTLELFERHADAAADFDERIVEARQQTGMHIGNGKCGTTGRFDQDALRIGKFQAGGHGIGIADENTFDRVMLRQIEDMLRHLPRAERGGNRCNGRQRNTLIGLEACMK